MPIRGRGKEKGKKKKKEGKQKCITTLGSHNENDRLGILWWWAHTRLFAGVSFVAQSLPSVTPLGDLYGASRKFVIFCAGASGGKALRGVSLAVFG